MLSNDCYWLHGICVVVSKLQYVDNKMNGVVASYIGHQGKLCLYALKVSQCMIVQEDNN